MRNSDSIMTKSHGIMTNSGGIMTKSDGIMMSCDRVWASMAGIATRSDALTTNGRRSRTPLPDILTRKHPPADGTRRYARRQAAALRKSLTLLTLVCTAACGKDSSIPVTPIVIIPKDTTTITPPVTASALTVLGQGTVIDRYTSELWVRGTTAYTSSWGTRGVTVGNAVKIWDVSGTSPLLVDSVIVANAGTTGDVQVSDDGTILAVAIEPRPNGGLAIYSLADPRKPQLITRYSSPRLQAGVHTAELARVNGTLYAFCAIDPANLVRAQLVIVSLANPAVPVEVSAMTIGNPFIHDVFVRDGLLFTAEWNDGVAIYDIGATSGTVEAPKYIGRVQTVGGQVHNMWWFNDPTTSEKRYVFVGQEGPGSIGFSSIGDIHVVDISNRAVPKEVAVYSVAGAGVHNLSMDEANGRLYAAYYNGGVKVLNVRGDLSKCTAAQQTNDGRCDLAKMGRLVAFTSNSGLAYVWGVHWQSNALYASDMLSGLWKFALP